jgi:hypothetical protein
MDVNAPQALKNNTFTNSMKHTLPIKGLFSNPFSANSAFGRLFFLFIFHFLLFGVVAANPNWDSKTVTRIFNTEKTFEKYAETKVFSSRFVKDSGDIYQKIPFARLSSRLPRVNFWKYLICPSLVNVGLAFG